MSDMDNFYTWATEERGGLLVTEKGGAGSGRYPKGSGEGDGKREFSPAIQKTFESESLPLKKLKFGDQVTWLEDVDGKTKVKFGMLASPSPSGNLIVKHRDGSESEVKKDWLRLQKGAPRARGE
jgi:hypothetical protein